MTREEAIKILKDYPNCTVGQLSKVPVKALFEFLETMPHWIPVDERLPETIDWYLCYNDLEDGCEVLHWEGDGNVWMDNDWHYKDKEVTHWMPLPQAPRNEDKK